MEQSINHLKDNYTLDNSVAHATQMKNYIREIKCSCSEVRVVSQWVKVS